MILILSAILFIGAVISEKREIPSFVQLCRPADPNFNKCWKRSAQSIFHRLKDPMPEMGLPSIEPLKIPKIQIDFGDKNSNATSLNGQLLNVDLYGLSKTIFNNVNVTFEEELMTFQLNITSKELFLQADFKANGQMLLLKFESDGKFNANLTNVDIYLFYAIKFVTKNGEKYGEYDEKLSYTRMDQIGHIYLYFDNLIAGQPDLNVNINNVINDNVDILYDEMKPIIQNVLSSITIECSKRVYELFSIDQLYPK